MPYKEGRTWRGVVKIGGIRIAQKRGFRRKRDAQEWEDEKRQEHLESLKQQNGTDLLTLCTKYLEYAEAAFSRKVYSEKNCICKRITAAWGQDTEADDITTNQILDYLNSHKKSNDRFNKERKGLLAIWNWWVQILDIKNNPVTKIRQLPHNRKPQYVPPKEDIFKLLAIATPEERVFLNLFLCTGARRSEVLRLTWQNDIDFENRQIRLGTRKSRDGSMKYTWLPMTDRLHDSLKWLWKNRADNHYLFVSKRGPWTERRGFLDDLCTRAKIRSFGYHALRRHVASVLAAQNVPLKTIQTILRHSSMRTTEGYIYNLNVDLKDTLELISENSSVPQSGTPKAETGD